MPTLACPRKPDRLLTLERLTGPSSKVISASLLLMMEDRAHSFFSFPWLSCQANSTHTLLVGRSKPSRLVQMGLSANGTSALTRSPCLSYLTV